MLNLLVCLDFAQFNHLNTPFRSLELNSEGSESCMASSCDLTMNRLARHYQSPLPVPAAIVEESKSNHIVRIRFILCQGQFLFALVSCG